MEIVNFTPYAALAGGALIGLSASLLMLASGRIAGIAGILGGLFRPVPGEWGWRIAFLVGLLLGPMLVGLLGGRVPAPSFQTGTLGMIAAGLLVGFGTRLGAGCTSGHGVCGLARLSPRSLAATLIFMTAAIVTVYLLRHLVGG
ncbi:YeeE/YedE family protein [Algihabitans albus]|uniref:YeeE/YedE family protein n=1 Tax=Algihabitans albus TaxID=2164067 RepID=UPI001ABBE464|nr:YeeE/YedE family protein [Algihabitans albus]